MSSPWKLPSPTSVTSAPTASTTMQAIMDEEFARQLYEEDCRALERELNASLQLNAFGHMRHDDRGAERWGADSFDNDELDEDQHGALEGKPAPPPLAMPRRHATEHVKPATASTFAGKKQHFDRSLPVQADGKGFSSYKESVRKQEKASARGASGRVEAAAIATRDSVMDERTERILDKMINAAELDAVHGCVQSGKEAHVYHAIGTDEFTMRQREFAIKIFKTTLSEFSNRHEYVTGDRRFDLHYGKKDMRRQLKIWTEKEFKNLCRAVRCIRAPVPKAFKEHVLVMDFIGADGWPAPTLKEAQLTTAQLEHAYADILVAVRTLYQQEHLVHADLSEYNILVHKQKCWIIDFGQATDKSHPDFDEYLKRDLRNVHRFFQRAGMVPASAEDVGVLSEEEAYDYVVTESPAAVVAEFEPLRALLETKEQQQARDVVKNMPPVSSA